MLDITAVVLSPSPVVSRYESVYTLNHVSTFQDMAGLLDAYFTAALKVRTSHFFFLDWDDDLPDDYHSVLEECLRQDKPLVYTEEIIKTQVDQRVHSPGEYNIDRIIKNPKLIHHLALCQTDKAQAAIAELPRGTYAMEPMLYSRLAESGWAFVPRVGYIWNKQATGMHVHPTAILGNVRARRALWERYVASQ